MVEAGKVTLRVEVDAKQFKQIMREITTDNANFKKQIENTEPALKKMGDTATTTAVRFQTLTQGTINLVTSFTQAYTSISNLQKAKTSLQAAAVKKKTISIKSGDEKGSSRLSEN
jgi:multidrug resistance efflux pump